ncbi:WD40 repeat-like protein [Rhizodiscina lignyota]|uniref:WD repeat-containing protein JIP5 n=1 Tax=Rhizodiscina lignyota TaxID=1504668 RepID=A0A9P4IP35_9PEZI|nr:WD40 repeat-like protein [Rhizodiscina lignyota]
MLDTLCTLPLSSDLFALSLHPSDPILAVGLSSGHVQCYKLPPPPPSDSNGSVASAATNASEASNGRAQIETAWKTRRHKGSCRSLAFSWDGQLVFSAGTDGLVKGARSESGVVETKIAVPGDPVSGSEDSPVVLHALTPQTLLLATDSSALHIYDLRASSKKSPATIASKPNSTYRPHDDYISSITPLPPTDASTSGLPKQWLSTGGTTIAITDLRRGVLVKSEDQEEELLSSCFVTGLSARGTSTGQKALIGSGDGIITLWEKGQWDDQDERIIVDRGVGGMGGESLDCMVQVPEEMAMGKTVAVGMGGGLVRFVRLGPNKVVGECTHDEIEGVVGLGFDVGGRMVSGGGQVVKVWGEKVGEVDKEEEEEAETNGVGKRGLGDDSEDDDDDEEDSSEDEKPKQKRKKRRRNRGKDLNGKKNNFSFKGLD